MVRPLLTEFATETGEVSRHKGFAPMGNERLEKKERIRKRSEYLVIYEEGARKHSEHFTVIVRKTEGGTSRLGIAVGKKVGNAVKRNRLKRLIREFFRRHKDRLSGVQDTVIIGKKFTSALTYQSVCAELEGLLISKADS